MNAFAVLVSLSLLAACIRPTLGWADEGHLLVGAIARQLMKKDQVQAIEGILNFTLPLYSDLNRIDHIAVWADHIKCKKKHAWCKGLARYPGVEVFNDFHFVDIPYNPQGVKVPPQQRVNAEKFLTEALETLRDFGARQREGTAFSWLFLTAMTIHIWGDIHQPLHSCSLYSKGYPSGDHGGNEIRVHVPESWRYEVVANLHALWDIGGGPLTESWPQFDKGLQQKAEELVRKYKNVTQSSAARIVDPAHVVDESHDLCANIVYKELSTSELNHKSPYRPSSSYIQTVQAVSEKQIVLGGARLAHLLAEISENAPKPEDLLPTLPPPGPVVPQKNPLARWIFAGLVVVALLGWGCVALLAHKLNNERKRVRTNALLSAPPMTLQNA